MIFYGLEFAHDGEKHYSMVFLDMKKASSCDVRSFALLVVFHVYLSYFSRILMLKYL